MKSHEIIKDAVDAIGVKRVSAEMKLSTSMIYKWSQAPCEEDEASGARNPLDRTLGLWEITGENALIDWLCQHAGGTFVPDHVADTEDFNSDYVQRTQKMISNFSELLNVVSESIADDGKVDQLEASRIRKEWQELKQHAEAFVNSCEDGTFHN